MRCGSRHDVGHCVSLLWLPAQRQVETATGLVEAVGGLVDAVGHVVELGLHAEVFRELPVGVEIGGRIAQAAARCWRRRRSGRRRGSRDPPKRQAPMRVVGARSQLLLGPARQLAAVELIARVEPVGRGAQGQRIERTLVSQRPAIDPRARDVDRQGGVGHEAADLVVEADQLDFLPVRRPGDAYVRVLAASRAAGPGCRNRESTTG